MSKLKISDVRRLSSCENCDNSIYCNFFICLKHRIEVYANDCCFNYKKRFIENKYLNDEYDKEKRFGIIEIPSCDNCKNSHFKREGYSKTLMCRLLNDLEVEENNMCKKWEKIK